MEDRRPIGAGRGSFDLIDPTKLFGEIGVVKGTVFLDLGCGSGHYVLAAAEAIGNAGVVHAIDLWEEGIATVREQVAARGLSNVKAMVSDICVRVPLDDESVDVCLMATILHDLVRIGTADGAVKEAQRVLKPAGSFAVVEFKKIDGPPGPPMSIRLTPDEVEKRVTAHGFEKRRLVEVGPYNYLMMFGVRRKTKKS